MKNSVLVTHFTAVAMVFFLNNECNYHQPGLFVVGLHSLDSMHLFYFMAIVHFYFFICYDSCSYLYCFFFYFFLILTSASNKIRFHYFKIIRSSAEELFGEKEMSE